MSRFKPRKPRKTTIRVDSSPDDLDLDDIGLGVEDDLEPIIEAEAHEETEEEEMDEETRESGPMHPLRRYYLLCRKTYRSEEEEAEIDRYDARMSEQGDWTSDRDTAREVLNELIQLTPRHETPKTKSKVVREGGYIVPRRFAD